MDIQTVVYAALVLFVAYLVRGIAGLRFRTSRCQCSPCSPGTARRAARRVPGLYWVWRVKG